VHHDIPALRKQVDGYIISKLNISKTGLVHLPADPYCTPWLQCPANRLSR